MAKEKRKPLTAIQLIEILRDRVKEYGDLPVTVNTQEGGTYSLYVRCDMDEPEDKGNASDNRHWIIEKTS